MKGYVVRHDNPPLTREQLCEEFGVTLDWIYRGRDRSTLAAETRRRLRAVP